MFHWICPECGREIAPTVRECPVCDGGAEQPELVLAGVVEASARALQADASGANGDRAGAASRVPSVDPVPASSLPELAKWARPIDDHEKPVVKSFAEPPTAEVSRDALMPEILDSKSAYRRSAEAKAAGIMGLLTRTADAWVHRPGAGEAKPVTTRTVESRAVESRSLEAKLSDVRSVESKPVESKPVESKIAESKPMESHAVEFHPAASGSLATPPVDTAPVDAAPVHVEPVEEKVGALSPHTGQSAELDAEESNSASAATVEPGLQPAESEGAPAKPADAPLDRIPLLAKLSRLALPKIAASPGNESSKRESSVDSAQAVPEKIETVSTSAAPVLPSTPGGEPRIVQAIEVPIETPPVSINNSDAKNLDANHAVAPEAMPQEPVLPVFAAPDRESLNALLSAVSMLDEDSESKQPDPPQAGKLPLSISVAHLTPVAPALVSIGAIEPRAFTATTRPASESINDSLRDNLVKSVVSPATSLEHKIAALGSADQPLPLQRPSAQPLTPAARQEPVPQAPRAGAVRSPRSSAPFLAPDVAGLAKYDPLENRPMQAIAPPADLRKSGTTPRITLPGPMLTRALVSFTGREFTPVFLEERAFRKRFAYGWVAAVLAVGTVLGVGFSSMVSPPGRPPVEAWAASEGSPSAAAESRTTMNAPVPATGANPLSKMIEVTGFRIVLDPSRKPQVEYLVVNHSSARFPDATIYVSLSTANAHVGQAPLCRFSFAAPDLGPYEAKEMISAIEKTNRPIDLPEWQDLRAEIEIGQ